MLQRNGSMLLNYVMTMNLKKPYSAYRVGITTDPVQRQKDHEAEFDGTPGWMQYSVGSLQQARDLEAYFKGLGCSGGLGGNMDHGKQAYVYFFESNEQPQAYKRLLQVLMTAQR